MMQMNTSKTTEIVDEENGTMQRVCELPNGLYRVEFYERYTGVKGWRFIFSDGDYTKECLEEELGIVFEADQEEEPMNKIEVTVWIGQHRETFSEDKFAEPAKVRAAADPVATCKKAIKSAKLSYNRYGGGIKGGLWYEGRIRVLEALLKELTADEQ